MDFPASIYYNILVDALLTPTSHASCWIKMTPPNGYRYQMTCLSTTFLETAQPPRSYNKYNPATEV